MAVFGELADCIAQLRTSSEVSAKSSGLIQALVCTSSSNEMALTGTDTLSDSAKYKEQSVLSPCTAYHSRTESPVMHRHIN